MAENVVLKKSFDFALQSVALYKNLLEKREFVLSKQFVRAATSIGANVSEASAAQTKRDFTSKMSIASKEARETLYWLQLLRGSNYISEKELLIPKAEELIRLLTAIVKTAQQNLNQ